MRGKAFRYILLAFGCIVSIFQSYANDDNNTIQLTYAIDYEALDLFNIDSAISLRHYLTNQSDGIVRLRFADAAIPIYTLQNTDGTQLQYHNALSLPSQPTDTERQEVNVAASGDNGVSAQTQQLSVELAPEDSYVFIDTLNLQSVEGIASGSYYVTATVTVRYVDNDSLTFYTVQSDYIRLDIRQDNTTHNSSDVRPTDSAIVDPVAATIDNTELSNNDNTIASLSNDFDGGYPHSVVNDMLVALVATDIEKFYSYFDIERLYRIDPSNNQRFIQASDIEREVLLEQFLLGLHNRPTFINSSLVPVQFEIHNTTYNRTNATVDVSMFFIYNDQELTTTTSILLEFINGSWMAIDYIALPER